MTSADQHAVIGLYERYLARCNEHRFEELGEFVSEHVSGSGPVDGLAAYVDGVKAVCTAFPDYHWDLQQRIVDGDTIAARLVGRGTHSGPFSGIAPTGRRIQVQELVVYRITGGKIVNCWGDLFPVVRDALRSAPPSARTSRTRDDRERDPSGQQRADRLGAPRATAAPWMPLASAPSARRASLPGSPARRWSGAESPSGCPPERHVEGEDLAPDGPAPVVRS